MKPEDSRHIYTKDIVVKVWGKGQQIDLRHKDIRACAVPTEFHIKEDGDIFNGPSVAILMEDSFGIAVVGEISYNMLKPVFEKMDAIDKQQKSAPC